MGRLTLAEQVLRRLFRLCAAPPRLIESIGTLRCGVPLVLAQASHRPPR